MTFWLFAILISAIAAAALYYAAVGGRVDAAAGGLGEARDAHFRLQLREIETDLATGRLAAAEGVAARAELARELLRQEREAKGRGPARPAPTALVLPVSIAVAVAGAFLAYAYLGSPGLPSEPFAARPEAAAETIDLDAAVKAVEARLATAPDDLRGWQVIAPIYMRTGRYADAERAFRRVIALTPPSADSDTDLAEALMLQHDGAATGEAADLLHKAAALDPHHIRSRFYLAAEAMRTKDYADAVTQWTGLIALGTGNETWLPTARAGLAAAEAGRDGKPLPTARSPSETASPAIRQMVEGLSERLAKSGGSLDDWTRLVRSQIVLGDLAKAQTAYDAARKAYPDAADRAELDGLAAQAGLKLDGGKP
jgi:cytochrome c-type biogenesis protein CcmH